MAALVRSLVSPLLRNPVSWRFLNGTVLRLARKMDQWRQAYVEREPALDESIRGRFLNGIVRHGLFYGMKYPSLESAGSALYPKLLGSYERELHGVMEKIVHTKYDTVVDVGCAEGYYATGLALRLPEAKVFAFDVNERAQYLCREMAQFNGVGDRVEVRAHCSPEVLMELPLGQRALIISDCEGYEHQLFSEECVAALAGHDVLIEVHAFVNPDIPVLLRQRFAATHRVQAVASTADADKPAQYPWRGHENFSSEEWRALLAEGRPGIMEWLWFAAGTEARE
jgi:hypothetical protein